MKKLFVLLLGLLLTVTLASCGSNETKDTNAPVISGNQDLTGEVNKSIDLLAGIQAIDEEDGVLTNNIQISIEPTLQITNGTVTPTQPGDYEIKYSVIDKAGNEGTAFATLTVTKALAAKVLYKTFEIGAQQDNAYSVWNHEDTEVTSGIVKGNYQVKGTKVDNEAWHIKFEGQTSVVANAQYTVTYKFNSDVEGDVTMEAYDYSQYNKTVAIAIGYNEVSFKFNATEAKEDQKFCLQLGALPQFQLDFSEITITETIGEDVWLSVSDVNVTEASVNGIFDNNSDGTVAVENNITTLNLTKGSDENNLWNTKLTIATGVDLEANNKYRISCDVEATKKLPNLELLYNTGDVEKGLGALYGQVVEANDKKTFTYVCEPDAEKLDIVLMFQVGQQVTQGDSNVIKVSNIKVEKVCNEDTLLTTDYKFTVADSHFWSDSVGSFEAAADGSKATLTVTTGTTTPNCWEMLVAVGMGTKLEANREYEVSIDVLPSMSVSNNLECVVRHAGTENNVGNVKQLEFSANTKQTVTLTLTTSEEVANPALVFQVGGIQEAGTVEFTNLMVVAKGGSKTETTTSQTFTPTGFGTYNASDNNAEGYLYIEDGKLVYEMTKIGLTDWHNKMYISDINLEAGKIYTFEFVAYSDKDIKCAFFLNVTSKWDPRLSKEVSFTTTEQTYSFQMDKSFAADMNFELLWQFGSQENNQLGGAKITFKSIKIYAQDVE